MASEATNPGGFAFPTTGGRLLLGPDPTGDINTGSTTAPAPAVEAPAAPAPSPATAQPGLQAQQSGDRENLYSPESPTVATDAPAPAAPARPVPADPNAAAGAGAWQSIREAASGLGVDLSKFADDRAALAHLVQRANANTQAEYYAQLGRQLAPHYQGIQGYLKQQQVPAQPAAAPTWQPPPFDDRWASLVIRDEASGVFVAKPGVDPGIAQAVNKYVDWNNSFQRDPASMIQPMVEERAKAIARAAIQEHFAAQTQQTAIQDIAATNAEWLYQTGTDGQRMRDAAGTFALTPIGARYVHHLRAVASMGVRDPRAQDALAKNLVRGEVAWQANQAAAAANGQAANPQTTGALARPNVNQLQSLPPSQRQTTYAATEPSTQGLSLRDMLLANFQAEGVTDADFATP